MKMQLFQKDFVKQNFHLDLCFFWKETYTVDDAKWVHKDNKEKFGFAKFIKIYFIKHEDKVNLRLNLVLDCCS